MTYPNPTIDKSIMPIRANRNTMRLWNLKCMNRPFKVLNVREGNIMELNYDQSQKRATKLSIRKDLELNRKKYNLKTLSYVDSFVESADFCLQFLTQTLLSASLSNLSTLILHSEFVFGIDWEFLSAKIKRLPIAKSLKSLRIEDTCTFAPAFNRKLNHLTEAFPYLTSIHLKLVSGNEVDFTPHHLYAKHLKVLFLEINLEHPEQVTNVKDAKLMLNSIFTVFEKLSLTSLHLKLKSKIRENKLFADRGNSNYLDSFIDNFRLLRLKVEYAFQSDSKESSLISLETRDPMNNFSCLSNINKICKVHQIFSCRRLPMKSICLNTIKQRQIKLIFNFLLNNTIPSQLELLCLTLQVKDFRVICRLYSSLVTSITALKQVDLYIRYQVNLSIKEIQEMRRSFRASVGNLAIYVKISDQSYPLDTIQEWCMKSGMIMSNDLFDRKRLKNSVKISEYYNGRYFHLNLDV
jgi:hypothetical protein